MADVFVGREEDPRAEEVSGGMGGMVETKRRDSRLAQSCGRSAPSDSNAHVFGSLVK